MCAWPPTCLFAGWVYRNTFDFIIVVTSLLDVLLGVAAGLTAFRLFRVLRFFKTFQDKQLRYLYELIAKAFASLAQVIALLTLVYCGKCNKLFPHCFPLKMEGSFNQDRLPMTNEICLAVCVLGHRLASLPVM